MTPAQAWALATRVYLDPDAPQEQREREWLLRASRALRAGNWVHLARMVDVCDLLQIPPPPQLAEALVPVFQAAATGHGLSAPRGGQHASLMRRAASTVQAVESLMQYEAARERIQSAQRVRRGRTALDEAAAYFRATSVRLEVVRRAPDGRVEEWREVPARVSDGYHLPRSSDALKKQVERARELLRDTEARDFIGANFPPKLLDRLAGK
jgi:hypothetical protein